MDASLTANNPQRDSSRLARPSRSRAPLSDGHSHSAPLMATSSARRSLPLLLGLSMLRTATPFYSSLAPLSQPRYFCMLGGGGGFGKPAAKKGGGKKAGGGTKKRAASSGSGFASMPKDTFKYTGTMRPGIQSPPRTIPSNIIKPDYADDGRPKAGGPLLPWQIEVKTAADIKGMRIAGRVAREILDLACAAAVPGVTTDSIDALVHEECLKRGAYPSPLNYHGFPKSCCTSVNEVICHGIPDSYVLQDGDIVNVDITTYVGGYHGDCSETVCVGEVDEAGRQLVQVTYDCWQAAIDYCKPGALYKGIGSIIEDHIQPYGYTTVQHFCGHGIVSVWSTTYTCTCTRRPLSTPTHSHACSSSLSLFLRANNRARSSTPRPTSSTIGTTSPVRWR